MKLHVIKTEILKSGDNIVKAVLKSMKGQGLHLEDGDILVVASKIVACTEGRIANLANVKPSKNARELARKFSMNPEFAELIIQEADVIFGGVERAILTLKSGVLTPNAGIDHKNAHVGSAILWPEDAKKWVKDAREEAKQRTGKNIAVLIVDSGLIPLRRGTIGLALATAGFKPIIDCRGETDVFGKPLVITQRAVADDLASAAHLMMGEAAERTPAVLIKEAPVVFDNSVYGPSDMMIPSEECIFMNALKAESVKFCA